MKYKLENGQLIGEYQAFTYNGIQYPDNWLSLATPEERQAIGITEVPDYPRPDDRFYWVTQNPDGTYTAIPKDLTQLKADWTSQVNATAYSLLMPSDWMVVRRAEDGAPIPAQWTAYRSAVRTYAQTVKTEISQANSVEALISVVNGIQWPKSPDQDA